MNKNKNTNNTVANLHDYFTGEYIRPATTEEEKQSRQKAHLTGASVGRILVDGRWCYVNSKRT